MLQRQNNLLNGNQSYYTKVKLYVYTVTWWGIAGDVNP